MQSGRLSEMPRVALASLPAGTPTALRHFTDDLTVVLLLKGRDDFTLRWFEYAKKYSMPYRVLIADGNATDGIAGKLEAAGFRGHVSYEYVRYPFDRDIAAYHAKVLDSLSRVETPFVLLASNDDFYFFDEVARSVHFLETNPEFVTARGEIWDFSVSSHAANRRNRTSGNYIYGEIEGLKPLYTHTSVLPDSALERAIDFASRYHSVWHDVARTEWLRRAFGMVVESNVTDLRYADLLVSFGAAVHGKILRGDGLFMLHQCHPDMAALTLAGDTPLDWIAGKGWRDDLNAFVERISLQISEKDGRDFLDVKLDVSTAYLVDFILNVMVRGYYGHDSRVEYVQPTSRKTKLRSAVVRALKHHPAGLRLVKAIVRRRGLRSSFPAPPNFGGKVEEVAAFLRSGGAD